MHNKQKSTETQYTTEAMSKFNEATRYKVLKRLYERITESHNINVYQPNEIDEYSIATEALNTFK